MALAAPTAAHLTLEQLADIFGYQLKRRPLTALESAELRGLKLNTQEHERVQGRGPRYFRANGRIYYSERDILEWLVAGARYSTAENVH
jgi:hypothetical protein